MGLPTCLQRIEGDNAASVQAFLSGDERVLDVYEGIDLRVDPSRQCSSNGALAVTERYVPCMSSAM